ncbi:hypothetical protein [Caballeronia zhejiangensis]|uniref:Glycosyltransferase n=1 Tax=Caballeronia zhejiangensis TaxID=871203 RepID=A0A656QEC8_9BURK|nr:hypothetical protein [Caballeronia zhejiangensis]KDR25114.1 hypothetical protein BG60_31205 [Caballeronia zhejiangensis]
MIISKKMMSYTYRAKNGASIMRLEGVYINLERSKERRHSIERQLHDLGCEDWIKRFAAVDGSTRGPFVGVVENSVWACRQSHTEAIADSDDSSALLILEDDVEISRSFSKIANPATLSEFIARHPTCDILFLDCCSFYAQAPFLLSLSEIQMKNRMRGDASEEDRHALSGVSIIDARGIFAYCSACYVVTPKGKQTLRQLFSEEPDPGIAVDILYRDWISSGRVMANLTVPFLATPSFRNVSTIPYEKLDYLPVGEREGLLANAIRRLLFAGDHRLDMTEMAALISDAEGSPEYELGMKLYQSCRAMA